VELRGTVAVVTGAGRGIGRAAALRLARGGAAIVGAARTAADLESLAGEVAALERECLTVVADLTEEAQAERLIRAAVERFGTIDLLVNNAGTNTVNPIQQVSGAQYREIVAANTDSTFYCTRAVVPLMIERRAGKIINVGSSAGRRGSATRAAYSAAKFAVVGFGEAVQQDLKRYGITVSAVLPGPVATTLRARNAPTEDQSKNLPPEEVAEAIYYLATRPQDVIIPEIMIQPRWTV
jgi:NADP-dependent 3-hydroxy acid dehydrogenase YdfG